jgi:hypothetical protein
LFKPMPFGLIAAGKTPFKVFYSFQKNGVMKT